MSTLKIRGRQADTDQSYMSLNFANQRFEETSADSAFVTEAVNDEAQYLATKSYIDQKDSTKALISSVTSADNNYLPRSQLDVASGVPVYGTDGLVKAANMPTIKQDRVPQIYTMTNRYFSNNPTVNGGAVRCADVVVSDPGWPYRPLAFGTLLNKGDPSADGFYTSFGFAYIQGNSQGQVGKGLGKALKEWHTIQLVPHCVSNGTGSGGGSVTGFTGSQTYTMYGALYSGDSTVMLSSVLMTMTIILIPVF